MIGMALGVGMTVAALVCLLGYWVLFPAGALVTLGAVLADVKE